VKSSRLIVSVDLEEVLALLLIELFIGLSRFTSPLHLQTETLTHKIAFSSSGRAPRCPSESYNPAIRVLKRI
jgi:hypothetical protein